MARGEGEIEESGLKSHFVERVVKLPMVHVAWDYASNTYSHIKGSSKLVNFTLTNAEKSVNFVAGQAKPVVLRFGKQIQAVDKLACKGLGTLEEKVPFITKPADEIIGDTRKLYTQTVYSRLEGIRKYGTDTVKSVTDYGLEKANVILSTRLVQSVLTSVDGALVVTENYIDHVLPPVDGENQNDANQEKADKRKGLMRAAHITNKVRHRAYRNLVVKFEYAQERTVELLLTYPVAVVEYSKEHLDAVVEFANKLWLVLKQEETDGSDSEMSGVEQQLLHLARIVARQLASAYTTATRVMPLSPQQSDATESSEGKAPESARTMRQRALWMYGVLRLVPSLAPTYMYAVLIWLEQLRTGKPKQPDHAKENGSVAKDGSNSTCNNVHVKHEGCNSHFHEPEQRDISEEHQQHEECNTHE